MRITIENKDGVANNTIIKTADGVVLGSVSGIVLRIVAGEALRAETTFLVPGVEAAADVTVSEAHLRELASAHGFDLVAKKKPLFKR